MMHKITIEPNYDYFLMDEEDVALDLGDLYDVEGHPISIPEFEEWQEEIRPIIIASETGKPYEKDWKNYHERGLKLAYRLRKLLSSDYVLWYEPPFEDKSGLIEHPILIK